MLFETIINLCVMFLAKLKLLFGLVVVLEMSKEKIIDTSDRQHHFESTSTLSGCMLHLSWSYFFFFEKNVFL